MIPYVPKAVQSETPIDQAIRIMDENMTRYGIHSVYAGRNIVNGIDRGAAVVCVVEDKGPRAYSECIPPYIVTPSGNKIPTDVVQDRKKDNLRLVLPDYSPFAENDYQRCYNCPIPGAVQVAPEGKNWVGSGGAAVRVKNADGTVWYGIVTNNHVAGGVGAIGQKLCQPHGRAGWIGVFKIVLPIYLDGRANYVDVAIADTFRTDGPFAPGTHTVIPRQLTFGRINPSPKDAQVRDIAKQEGRTIGATVGQCIGVNGTSHVGYDGGTAVFRGQDVYEASVGQFSAGGHSGSIIFSEDMRPMSLLFAGGGKQTLGNPIRFVMEATGMEFF